MESSDQQEVLQRNEKRRSAWRHFASTLRSVEVQPYTEGICRGNENFSMLTGADFGEFRSRLQQITLPPDMFEIPSDQLEQRFRELLAVASVEVVRCIIKDRIVSCNAMSTIMQARSPHPD